MQDFEKLGAFYLGREFDLAGNQPREDLLLYDARDLTTHAVCVGMTGSGKTGLCLALLEEAAIDGIPAIIIDPKGDLGNLMLTFPELRPDDFRPWVDSADAARQGTSVEQLAQKTSDAWRAGLQSWGQSPERIARFREAAEVAIYTPGSGAGLPLTILRSFSAPGAETLDNPEALRERISATVSGLLGLLGIEADPLQSREHIFLANLFDRAWREGRDLDLGLLIREIQSPPFDKIGVLDLESVFPSAERFGLSMRLNNLLASPGFSSWLEGEPLDVQRLLFTQAGKPRIAVLSIAHLTDNERMFFVTILLNEVIAWMRRQQGTSSLRAILYMDEVFGYFPPSANPPSKTPMLTLLKQARAFGLGVVLATQNPVDLDYKGLANAGTWFIGRLQTERDKARLLDGLEGASVAAGGTFDRQRMQTTLASLGNRVFLMNNVHDDEPVVFQTRWTLSYLRGPLTRDQIGRLMAKPKSEGLLSPPAAAPGGAARAANVRDALPGSTAGSPALAGGSTGGSRPVLPPEVSEMFVPIRGRLPEKGGASYRPFVVGSARVHFAHTKSGVDIWETLWLRAPASQEVSAEFWDSVEIHTDDELELEATPVEGAVFAELPAILSRPKTYAQLTTALKDFLYRTHALRIWKCPSLKQFSKPGESEGDFRARLSQSARESRDASLEKLRDRFAPKVAVLQDRLRRASQRVDREKSQASQQGVSAALSMGSTLLGALFGRKLASAANVGRAATSMRAAGRIGRERQDVAQAEENVQTLQAQIQELDAQLTAETAALQSESTTERLALEELVIKPKKSDITVTRVVLAWASEDR